MDTAPDPVPFAPVDLLPGRAFVPLDATCAFDAAPGQTVYLAVVAAIEGDPGAAVHVGLAIDGATDHRPTNGFVVSATLDDAGRGTAEAAVHLLPWTPPTEAPRHWPAADRATWTPPPCPTGHIVAGAHRVALWARAEGGAARVTGALVVEAATARGELRGDGD